MAQGQNPGPQVWWQVPLSSVPSRWPLWLTDVINAPEGVYIVIKGLGTASNKVVQILAEELTSYNTQEAI